MSFAYSRKRIPPYPPGIVAWYNWGPADVNSDTALWPDVSGKGVDLTGVSDPVIAADGSRTFDGTNDYFKQKVYDTQQGALSYDTNNFVDAGQAFAEWSTTAPGTAAYMIVITQADASVRWGYIGTLVNATTVTIYTTKALTTAGFNGAAAGTASSYEVRKTDFQITGSMTILMWVKPDDGQPAAYQTLFSKYGHSAETLSSVLFLSNSAKLVFYTGDGTDTTDYQTTDAAVFTDGAQAVFTHIGVIYTSGVGATLDFYKNGAVVASTVNPGGTIQTALRDISYPVTIGADSTAADAFDGQIASVMVFNRALTAAEVKRVYDMHKGYFGL